MIGEIGALLAVTSLGIAGVLTGWRCTPARPLAIDQRPRPWVPTERPDEWAAFLDAAAAEVRTGSSLQSAWQTALRRHAVMGAAVAPGRSLGDCLAGTTHDPDEAVVLQVGGAALSLGGPMAATLDAGAALLRERAASRAEAAVHSAQARLSAKVLTAVPLVFALWSTTSSESFRDSVASPAGLLCIGAGSIANVVGWWWMRRIVAGAER